MVECRMRHCRRVAGRLVVVVLVVTVSVKAVAASL